MAGERLREKLETLPKSAGVYLFRGGGGQVLYVGKAASLRDRVRSYLQPPGRLPAKVRRLMLQVRDVEVVATRSEAEALILEDALVKKHRPRFNVRLRDDKRYPYLKITPEPYPRVVVVRQFRADGGRYFGPFTSARAMRRVLKLAHRLFPLRTCNLPLNGVHLQRPCLLYHIGRCCGPCAGLVSPEEYRRHVDRAALLLAGRVEQVLAQLREQMQDAARREYFEHAAHLRDQIRALERVQERQAVELPELVDLDAVGVAAAEGAGHGQVLIVRGGRLIGREGFSLSVPAGTPLGEVLANFLGRYYTRATAIPQEVLLPQDVAGSSALADYLAGRRGGRVIVQVPSRGERRELVEMAQRNAALGLRRTEAERARPGEEAALDELAEAFELSVRPWRIEAFDISNLSGREATGSMVAFVGGRPRPDAYRRFRVRGEGKPDDYAMMEEVLRRRFAHGLAELADAAVAKGKFSDLPDLVLVDGGKGQLGVALRVLEEFELSGIEVAALAKREEQVYVPGGSRPVVLPRGSAALQLLQRVRDEAHRFAVNYHRRLRGRRALEGLLDEVEGVGPRRRNLLLSRFGSLEGLRRAPLEELLSVPGLPRSVAERLYKALHVSAR
ncbi:MAG: excinuclease ABC subunit UvrC [Candidatus Bipolaricaulaceae bacterium]